MLRDPHGTIAAVLDTFVPLMSLGRRVTGIFQSHTHKRIYCMILFYHLSIAIFVFDVQHNFYDSGSHLLFSIVGLFAQRTLLSGIPVTSATSQILHSLHHTHLRELVALAIRHPAGSPRDSKSQSSHESEVACLQKQHQRSMCYKILLLLLLQ